jgi:hypothetical protein
MASAVDFASVFKDLRGILEVHAPQLVVKTDNESNYYLDSAHLIKGKTPLFFGAVQIKKNYVSYHLMAIYMFPDLLIDISPALRKRMQGKSCFNFTRLEGPLLQELAQLTQAGINRFAAAGLFREGGLGSWADMVRGNGT